MKLTDLMLTDEQRRGAIDCRPTCPNETCEWCYYQHDTNCIPHERAAIANTIIELDKAGFFMVPLTPDFEDFAQQLDRNLELVNEAYEVMK